MSALRPRRAATGLPRGLHLLAWFAGMAVVDVALYASYQGEDASFHWFTHLFVGMAAALVVMILVARGTRRPVPVPFLWLLVGHLVAMGPDFAFLEGVAHGRWMD